MNNKFEFNVFEPDRLDKVIANELPQISRAKAQMLIKDKRVYLNGKIVLKSSLAKVDDVVEIDFPELEEVSINAENIPLDIVYEDEDLIVVNKAKGMVVHPAPGHYSGTMVNALMFYAKNSLSGINGEIRPGIVHRIDKNTSGLLVVAKNDVSHNFLAEQIKAHSMKREYRAVVYGKLKEDKGSVNAPLARNPKDRKKMAIVYNSPTSRQAISHYEVIERFKGFTYAKLVLETGRTHQIRVHMASLGNPVAGDDVYGPKKAITELKGQCLHAVTLGFIHPRTKEYMEFNTELPDYFKKFISKLQASM